jgi:hypothetical protein
MPVPLRADFDALQLWVFARKTKNGPQARRLLALASIYDGATRTETAKIGGLPTHGEQEMSAWNGHYECACYHPLVWQCYQEIACAPHGMAAVVFK